MHETKNRNKVPGIKKSVWSRMLGFAPAAALLLWLLPVRAQEAASPAPPPSPGAGAPAGAAAAPTAPTAPPGAAEGHGEAGAPGMPGAGAPTGAEGAHPAPAAGTGTSGEGTPGMPASGTIESHGPATDHAEGAAGTSAHGADAHGSGAHAEGKHEESISIHLPTWITGMLKKVYHGGPVSISVDGAVGEGGAPVGAADLTGQTATITHKDEHGHGAPEKVTGTIASVGTTRPSPGMPVESVTISGRQVILLNPKATFTLEKMFPEAVVISFLTALGILGVAMLMAKNPSRIPTPLQSAGEIIYEKLDNFVAPLIGPTYQRYLPLAATAFLYILTMNLVGLIPGWSSPTANLNVTAGMAIVVVVFVQIEGIRTNGFVGYLKHFVGEPAWLGPLNFPLHIVGELAKILSLSMRLFGNIFGEDVVIIILLGLGAKVFLPIQALLLPLAVFTSFVQAMVFTILMCVYIALMTTHEEHGEHDHGGGHEHTHGDDHGHAHAHAH